MKKWISSFILFLGVFLMPVFAFAESKGDNPITTIKEGLKLNWNALKGLGWAFYIISIPLTLMVAGLLVWCIWAMISHLLKVRRGKKSFKDAPFWIEMGATILIVFLFMSGAFWSVLEKVYDWTSDQKIGEEQSSAFLTPNSQTKIIIQFPITESKTESFLS